MPQFVFNLRASAVLCLQNRLCLNVVFVVGGAGVSPLLLLLKLLQRFRAWWRGVLGPLVLNCCLCGLVVNILYSARTFLAMRLLLLGSIVFLPVSVRLYTITMLLGVFNASVFNMSNNIYFVYYSYICNILIHTNIYIIYIYIK